MPFLHNAWYVGLWAHELPPLQPVSRRVLSEPLVFFRDAEGVAVALHDRCPHRAAPLHRGRVTPAGHIECGYHGLQFDAQGRCVLNPHGQGRAPAAATLRRYPVLERYGALWVWMGEGPADAALLPDLAPLETADPMHVTAREAIEMDVSYELVIDNLLDLSHTAFLHPGVLGNPGTTGQAAIEVTHTERSVSVSRWMPGVAPPGLFALLVPPDFGAVVDHWTTIQWLAPSCLINDTGITRAGQGIGAGTGIFGFHLLTPVDERHTRYHMVAVRQRPLPFPEPQRQHIMAQLRDLRRTAFATQDEPMIRAQQQMLDQTGAFTPVLLAVDAGVARARRVLDRQLADEQQRLQGDIA